MSGFRRKYSEYLDFLHLHHITSHDVLQQYVRDTYQMSIQKLSDDSTLYRIMSSSFTKDLDVPLLCGLILDSKSNVNIPVFFDESHIHMKPIELFNLPLNLNNWTIYLINGMVKCVLIKQASSWECISSHQDTRQIMKVFQYNFPQYQTVLNAQHVYVFYVGHNFLNQMYNCNYSCVRLFKIFNRSDYKEVELDGLTCHVQSLTQTEFSTKYALCDFMNNKDLPRQILLIDETDQKKHMVANTKFRALQSTCNMCNFIDPYKKFFSLLKDVSQEDIDEYLLYFSNEKFFFKSFTSMFRTVVSRVFHSYLDLYVEKKQSSCLDTCKIKNKSEILYKIHQIHLQTNKKISKKDIKRFLLNGIDDNKIISFIKDFHKITHTK